MYNIRLLFAIKHLLVRISIISKSHICIGPPLTSNPFDSSSSEKEHFERNTMALTSESPALQRFRRVTKNHRIPLTENEFTLEWDEICHIRAKLNSVVYSRAQKWMLPRWVVRYLERNGSDSIGESGFRNTTHRNWVPIGGVGKKHVGVLESRGLLTTHFDTGSVEVWFVGPDGIIFPAVDEDTGLTLLSPEDQIYELKTKQGPVELTRLIYHTSEDENEAVYNEVSFQNFALEPQNISFIFAVRPMSVLGVEPIESIEYDEARGRIYVNGLLACILDGTPSSVIMSTADNPNSLETILTGDRVDTSYSTSRGLGTAMFRFDVNLPPAGSVEFFFACPLSRVEKGANEPEFTLDPVACDTSVESWFSLAGHRLAGTYPNQHLGEVLSQAKAVLIMQAYSYLLEDNPQVHLTRGSEQARILHTLAICGCEPVASSLALLLAEKHLGDSSIDSGAGVAPLLWGILQSYELNRSAEQLDIFFPFIDKSLPLILNLVLRMLVPDGRSVVESSPQAEATVREEKYETAGEESATEKSPILPEPSKSTGDDHPSWVKALESDIETVQGETASKGTPRDDGGEDTLDDIERFIELIWVSAALKSVALVLKAREENVRTLAIERILNRLGEAVSSSAQAVTESDLTPEKALTVISTISLAGTSGIDVSALERKAEGKARSSFRRGLFRFQGPPERISSHHSLRLAYYYAQNNQRHEAEELLNKAVECVSEHCILPEYVDIETWGGSHGDGSSIEAAADLLILVRTMLLYEAGDDLVLLPGIPEEWFTSTSLLVLNDIPTRLGPIDLELGSSKNQHQIEVRVKHLPREIELHVPHSFSLPLVKVFGGALIGRFPDEESPRIRVVPLSDRIVFTFHR